MHTQLGILLAVSGGLMVGFSMMPLNYLRRWRWENAWVVFSVVALVLMPCGLAVWRIPHLSSVYSSVRAADLGLPFLFGAGWGVAQVLFGLAVVRIGMALSFALTIGLSAALGTLMPILVRRPSALITGHGPFLILGLLLVLAGVASCSWAGRRREQTGQDQTSPGRQSATAGLLLAIGAGLLAPMLSYALAWGDSLLFAAARYHAASADVPYVLWPVVLAGGAVPNVLYAVSRLHAHKSWSNFFPVWPEIWTGVAMGALWMGSVAIYGMATTLLGSLGVSIGWSIYQICIILTANISGWFAGEWKGVSRQSQLAMWSGVVLLGISMIAITYGNN